MTTLLALSQMSAGWAAFFYVLAFLLALLAAFGARVWPDVFLFALAFAAFLVPITWDHLAAA